MGVEQREPDRRGGLPGSLARLGHPVVLAAAILLLTFAAYTPARLAGFIWDDDYYLTGNKLLDSAAGLREIWLNPEATPQYYPLVFSSFWVEKRLWGLDPRGYHLMNVLLHGANALLLWVLLRRLSVPGAWLAAAIFAVHPVHVESVAWITERKNVLSGLGYLAALLAYLRFSPPGEAIEPARRRWPFYALSLLLFAGALLAKTVVATLPAAILLLIWWQRGRIGWRDAAPLLPFFLLGAALGLHTAHLERASVGAEGAAWALTTPQRVLIAGRALWFYAGKLAWPRELLFIYPRWAVNAGIWWWYLFPAGAAGVVAALWLQRRAWGRGPLAAVFFFCGTLFPALGFFNLYPMRYSYVADHFQYLASIGLIALAAALVARRVVVSAGRGPAGAGAGQLLPALLILPVLVLATWRQTENYRNEETIWRSTLAGNPESWLAHNNLGVIFYRRGQVAAALGEYRAALRINPDYCETRNNLGCLLLDQGNAEAAIEHLREALRLCPPAADILYNLGLAAMQQGDDREAEAWYRKALQAAPGLKDAHRNLAYVLIRQGRRGEAAPHLAALSEQP